MNNFSNGIKSGLFSLFFLISAYLDAQTYLYVSPSGTGASFTEQTPGSLSDAKLRVRELALNMQSDIIVVLRGGRYELSASLTFNQDDSGRNGFSVIWKAFTNETPVFSGGIQVKNWVEDQNSIWKSNVTGKNFRQLYVDGERSVRARTPDRENDTDMGPYLRLKSWDIQNKRIIVNKDDVANIPADGNTEMVIQTHWDQQRVHVYKITSTSTDAQISVNNTEVSLFTQVWPQREPDQPYHFENSYSFLNKPEEWFYDYPNQQLYFIPKPGVDPNNLNVFIPRIEELIVMIGTHDVRFEGVVFEHTGWTQPDTYGIIDIQAVDYLPGVITLKDTKNLTFKNNTIRHAGGQGIILQGNTSGTQILGNLVYDISANPILIRGEGSNGDYIGHNTILGSGRDYSGAVGILAQLPANLVIENNDIGHLTYCGISLGWKWDEIVTACKGNIVRKNKVHNVMESLDDAAGIYTLGRQDGTQIYENYISEISHSPWSQRFPVAGIYTDQGTMNLEIFHNVLENLEQDFNSNTSFPNNLHDNNFSLPIKQAAGPAVEYKKDIPVAIITTDVTQGVAPFTVSLNGSNSTDPLNSPLIFEWLLPGGSREYGTQLQHKFENPGNYRIQLKVKNANGLTDVSIQNIIVHATYTDKNLAWRKSVSESSEYDGSTSASKGNDDQIGSIWASAVSDKQSWWQVDLGQAYKISEIQLVARQDDYLTNSRIYFQVWASNSSAMTNAVLLGSQSSSPYPKNGIWYAFPNDQGTYRYLRILKPGGGHWYFSEFRAFEALKTESTQIIISPDNSSKLFPNPADSQLTLCLSEHDLNCHPIVYSVQGKSITVPFRLSEDKMQFDTSGLANGMYLISIPNHQTQQVLRFSVLH